MKYIISVRAQPHFAAAAGMGDLSLGEQVRQAVSVNGVSCDESYAPIAFGAVNASPLHLMAAAGFDYGATTAPNAYLVRADIENAKALNRLKSTRRDVVLGVHVDLEIAAFRNKEAGGSGDPIGDAKDVASRMGIPALTKAGLTGAGVRVAIVDTGIDGTRVPVAGGWSIDGAYKPGSSSPWHGTMVAFDSHLVAPDAQLLDYALLRSVAGTWSAFLSDAIAAYSAIRDEVTRNPGPMVVNNSWALYDRTKDAPIGSPENYSANPGHPFCQVVENLVSAGCDVVFAAGNCGMDCPYSSCGIADRGSGKSIHGANSHPDVMTVAAVDIRDRRLCFSSQGPGGIYDRKPDIAAFSQFAGSGVMAADAGTSAAAPIVSGLIAALRQHPKLRTSSPAQIKGLLQKAARNTLGGLWTYDLGYGIVDAAAVMESLAAPDA